MTDKTLGGSGNLLQGVCICAHAGVASCDHKSELETQILRQGPLDPLLFLKLRICFAGFPHRLQNFTLREKEGSKGIKNDAKGTCSAEKDSLCSSLLMPLGPFCAKKCPRALGPYGNKIPLELFTVTFLVCLIYHIFGSCKKSCPKSCPRRCRKRTSKHASRWCLKVVLKAA